MPRYQGGMIASLANNPDVTNYTGKANGVFSLSQQIVNKSSSIWAIGQTIPNPPTIGTAASTGATSISVAFIPPVQNGGSNITSYTVTSSGGQTGTGTSSPIVVGGLTASTSYTFTVTATNAVGTSTSSEISNSLTPAITDPYFGSVSLLLNGDGTNGSTTFNDLSSTSKPITAAGNAVNSTSAYKNGSSSMYFDGTGDYLYVTTASSAFNYGTSNFTIEFWVYPQAGPASTYNPTFFTNHGDNDWNSIGTGVRIHHQNVLIGSSQITFSSAISNNVWTHIALVRSGNTITAYKNGTSVGSTSHTGSVGADSDRPALATSDSVNSSGREFLQGFIDDLRITKGVARYTANFTAPTTAFPTM